MRKTLIKVFIGITAFALNTSLWAEISLNKKASEHELGKIPKNRISEYVVSPDGKRVLYIVGEGGYADGFGAAEGWERYTLIVDGKAGERYPRITDPQFSPDSKRVAFLTGESIVVDGKHSGSRKDAPELSEIHNFHGFQFSPDSKSFAYVAANYKAGGPSYIVVNGARLKPFAHVHGPLFSPDSKRLAYTARKNEPYGELVVLDELEGKLYEQVTLDGNLIFSPNSKRLSYITSSGNSEELKRILVTDGINGKPYQGIGLDRKFSPDSQHVLYIAVIDNKNKAVVIDEKEGSHFDAWGIRNPVFSPDSKRVAFTVTPYHPDVKNGQQFVVVDGQEGKRYDKVGLNGAEFSFDSNHLSYAANNGVGWLIVLDGKEGKPYDFVSDMTFNPRDSQLAYVAHVRTKKFVVQEGRMGKKYDQITDLVFSDDGKALAYAAYTSKNKKWFVVVDGREGKTFDFVLARNAYDEKSSNSMRTSSLRFDSNESLRYLAVRKNRMLLIETPTH